MPALPAGKLKGHKIGFTRFIKNGQAEFFPRELRSPENIRLTIFFREIKYHLNIYQILI